MNKFNELLTILKSNQSFIITCHVNPDADAIGSEIAMAEILSQLGKNYKIINTSATPYNLKFLDPNNCITKFSSEQHTELIKNADAAIFLDMNFLNRTVRIEEYFRKFEGTKICIDHHTNPEHFADFEIIDESKTATGEILYDFIEEIEELEFNDQIAIPIYAAIMTDTGSFRFPKTTAATHKKIANLLRYNLKPEEVYDAIYNQYKFSRVKLLGEALHTISLSESAKVAYMIVTQESLIRSKAIESDVDGFVNFALTSKGVEVGILFFELKDGVKISFRSKGEIPVNKLAEAFGGGGHLNASGTRLYNISLEEIMPKVLSSADKLVSK